MKAVLKTLCGCSAEIEVPYPPNEYIVIPLNRSSWCRVTQDDGKLKNIHFKVRKFVLVDEDNFTAHYEEDGEI